MDTKHTYRRWFATQHPDDKARWFVQSDLMGGFDICEVSNYPKEANARLIAAAPELLEACQKLIWAVDKSPPVDMMKAIVLASDAARAAIAKATQP